MEIKGLGEFLLGKDKITMKDVKGISKATGVSLNNVVKSFILTLKKTNKDKYLECKNSYLEDVVKKYEEETLKNYSNEQIELAKDVQELELEIIKAKMEVINKKLEK